MAREREDEEEHGRRLPDAERPLLAESGSSSGTPSTLLTVCPFILGTFPQRHLILRTIIVAAGSIHLSACKSRILI